MRNVRKVGPITVETVQGEPIVVGEKELTPIARVISFVRRKGAIKKRGLAGGGGGFVLIEPMAVVESSPQGIRRLSVRDETRRALAGMLAAALIFPIALELAVRLIEQFRRSP